MTRRTLLARTVLVTVLVALATGASWLVPRLTAPPERFAVAMGLIEQGRAHDAIYLLDDPAWRGVAEYRAGRYRRALSQWINGEEVRDFYNLGNAYAQLHTWPAAKAAYREALSLDPGNENARFNLALVEKAEVAEKTMEEEARASREAGRWEDGNRKDEDDGGESGETVEEGGADEGAIGAAEDPTDRSGRSDQAGLLGEKALAADPQAGAGGGEAGDDPPEGDLAASGRALIRRESAQAAEVLLSLIRDDPARVLSARLAAQHKLRHQTEETR